MTATKDMNLLLAESLKTLSEKKAIEKITIKEITDQAGVIRPTFYNHFQDKYELIEWIIKTELLYPIRPLIMADMLTEALVLLFTNMKRDKVFYSKAVRMEGPVTFHEIAIRCVTESMLSIIEDTSRTVTKEYQWLTNEVIASFYAQSMCFAAEQWVLRSMEVSPRQMAEAYFFLMTHSMQDIVVKTDQE